MGQSCHRIFVDFPTVEVTSLLIPVKPIKFFEMLDSV
jgi:hypothetical protein